MRVIITAVGRDNSSRATVRAGGGWTADAVVVVVPAPAWQLVLRRTPIIAPFGRIDRRGQVNRCILLRSDTPA
jgi:hypothetical protein